jgi:hypothetical protein
VHLGAAVTLNAAVEFESAPDDDASWLALERFATTPRTETEVCRELGLGRGTARRLLTEGVASGRLVREGTPYRYVLAATASQRTLFDAA